MKVIFLDIDGVLTNPKTKFRTADPECVKHLNYITDSTDAKLVVSSTRRLCGFDSVNNFLCKWGITGHIIGLTPDLSIEDGKLVIGVERGEEIKAWLKDSIYETFVILDDDDDMGTVSQHLVLTNSQVGLCRDDANIAILKLNAEES